MKKAIKFGSNIDTDQILGAQYLTLPSIEEMAVHAFENYPQFVNDFQSGDMIVAENNFGCGSSREHSPAVLKQRKVGAIIANSFARIFYRNAINLGIPVIECKQANEIEHGDCLKIDLADGLIHNKTTGKTYHIEPFPGFIREIVKKGGIIKYINQND